ncbi:MAG: FAD-binding oxidoreductase [Vicinamibacteria bacterium]
MDKHWTVDNARVDELRAAFSGQVLRPGDDGYEDARKVHNGLIDKRPGLIARCAGLGDIIDAVQFARAHDLEVAVRCGGHNVAGRATIDDWLMIDLAPMKGIYVDPANRTIRAQGEVTWREFNRETEVYDLATTGGVISTTGIAGLTLGGGLGWLMGKYGMAVDNLLSAEMVTADGESLTASAENHPDLFWAIRGGGGNFGVAASFEYRLHPVGQITGGLAAHSVASAKDVLRFYRDFTASLPDEVTAFAGVTHAPDGSGAKIAFIAVCHCGPIEQGARALAAVKKFGSPIMDVIGPMHYGQLNAMLDAGFPRGALNNWKANCLRELSDQVIDTIVERFLAAPSTMSALMLEYFHGAVTRVGTTETAFPHRDRGYNLAIISQWLEPKDNARNIAWAKDSFAAMKPFVAAGRYVNYLGDDEVGDPVRAAYGPNYDRLVELKNQYDPTNFFHMNQNIRPTV